MSNGTLAELPPENKPDNITMPEEPAIMLLLPHNKYLLGTEGKWTLSHAGQRPSYINLYENQALSLSNEGTQPTIIPADTVNMLRKELLSLSEPPGRHEPAVLMLKTFMKDNPAFNDEKNFLNEENFSEFMKKDFTLYKAYWTLRFSLMRSELETAGRLKAWLKAGPEIFENPRSVMRIYFSILNLPEQNAIQELVEQFYFSSLELKHISNQTASPLVIYNPVSGWLIVAGFNRKFKAWVYINHELYHELRYIKKLSIHDIIQASWGEYETQQALKEREKYKR